METVRIVFLADTHLGIDMPARPRIERRRRGEDFFENYKEILSTVARESADVVVHGGDVFYRSRVRASLVQTVFEPILALAEKGVSVFIVPGNHERSRIPFPLLAQHPDVHIFDRPRTFVYSKGGLSVSLSGFPFVRNNVRNRFPSLVRLTGWQDRKASCRVLCIHQAVEGATVGPKGFTFRSGADVIKGAQIPADFNLVLAGHIHRAQVLKKDLSGRPLGAPVLYPGSIERTSFAEKDERKGFVSIEIRKGAGSGNGTIRWRFKGLASRPMITRELDAAGLGPRALERRVRGVLASLERDAIVRLAITGQVAPRAACVLRAASMRALAPDTMSVAVVFPSNRERGS